MKRKIWSVVICITPIIFLIIGVIADIVVVPRIYGEDAFFTLQFFTEPKKAICTLLNPHAMLPGITRKTKILILILVGIWFFCFYISSFFFCKRLHFKPRPITAKSVSINNELCFQVQAVRGVLIKLKGHKSNKRLNKLIYSMKCLEEKLFFESDFGYGNDEVIACENEIVKYIRRLSDNVQNIETGEFDENIYNLNENVIYVTSLLRKRSELRRLQ